MRGSLRFIAHRAALLAYRIGFERGQLGQTHAVVADEVLHLVADELQARAGRARRRGRWLLLVTAVEIVVGFVLHAAWGVEVLRPTDSPSGIGYLVFSATALLLYRTYGEYGALRSAASDIEPPTASKIDVSVGDE